MIYEAIKKLVQYGLDTGLITEVDKIYATNQILYCLINQIGRAHG